MQPKTFAIVMSVVIFLVVIELIRRQKMTFKYSIFWLVTCVVVLFFSFFDGLLAQLATLAGFTLPSNFVFFLLLVFFIMLSLVLTIYINEQNSKTESLAQQLAILDRKLQKLNARPSPPGRAGESEPPPAG
jgi:hypothetical protein